jgi:hypothetical protein
MPACAFIVMVIDRFSETVCWLLRHAASHSNYQFREAAMSMLACIAHKMVLLMASNMIVDSSHAMHSLMSGAESMVAMCSCSFVHANCKCNNAASTCTK